MQHTRLLQSVCVRLSRFGQLRAVTRALQSAHYATIPIPISRSPIPIPSASYATNAASTRSRRTPSSSNNNSNSSGNSARPVASVEELWTQLEAHYQQHGLLHHEHCVRLLEQLEAGNTAQRLSGEQLHFLLGGCVPELLPAQSASQRLQLFQRLWTQLRQQEPLALPHYATQLQMLRQNQLPLPDHRALLADMAVFHGPADAALYSTLLDVACASGNMRQATELLNEMRELSFSLTERNFHALLLGHARNSDLAGAESVLASMRAAGIESNASTEALRILGYVENAQPAKARELLLQQAGAFNAAQLLQLLRSCLRAASVDLELLQLLVRELPKDYVSGADVPAALRSLCIELLHHGQLELMGQLVAALPAPSFNENQHVDSYGVLLLQELFRARVPLEQTLAFAQGLRERGQNSRALHLVAELALRRQPAAALSCFEALAAAGEQLRPHYFWPLLLHQRRREGESGLLRLLGEMRRLEVPCDEETLRSYVLPQLWQTLQQPLEALQQLDSCGVRVSQALPHVLGQLLQQQLMAPALEMLQKYPTRLELATLIQPLAQLAVHARATKMFQQFAQLIQALQQRSLQRSEDFVGALLLQMCAPQTRLRQEPAALQRFAHELARLELRLSPRAAEALLAIAQQSGDKEALEALGKTLPKMREAQLTLSGEPASPQPASGGGSGGASSFIKHPRDMSRDELECHLIELEAKQLNTRGVLRRLLQLSVRDGRLERALEIKSKCEQLKVQTSAGMLAAIFDLHIKLKDVQRAQQSLQQLERTYPGFLIDEHKLIDYAALLVLGQQLEAAKQLLKQRSEKHRITGGDYVIKNVWQLLTNVAQMAATTNPPPTTTSTTAPPNSTTASPTSTTAPPTASLSREMFDFLRQLGYCHAHNALLGPIVREWLLRGDIDSAVAEFQRLAQQFKHTPLQFELLSLLVKLSNGDEAQLSRFAGCDAQAAQQHLAAVTGTVSRVHGAANMNSALLLALAESGTEVQLRRLAINPEFRINHELLLKNCEHLGQEGAVRTLLRLARGVRGLQRSIDEQRIYDLLLAQFAKANNYEAALDLFERLEGDDELKVSQDFLRNLVKLLQLNNVEIPSSIALRAQIR